MRLAKFWAEIVSCAFGGCVHQSVHKFSSVCFVWYFVIDVHGIWGCWPVGVNTNNKYVLVFSENSVIFEFKCVSTVCVFGIFVSGDPDLGLVCHMLPTHVYFLVAKIFLNI